MTFFFFIYCLLDHFTYVYCIKLWDSDHHTATKRVILSILYTANELVCLTIVNHRNPLLYFNMITECRAKEWSFYPITHTHTHFRPTLGLVCNHSVMCVKCDEWRQDGTAGVRNGQCFQGHTEFNGRSLTYPRLARRLWVEFWVLLPVQVAQREGRWHRHGTQFIYREERKCCQGRSCMVLVWHMDRTVSGWDCSRSETSHDICIISGYRILDHSAWCAPSAFWKV